MCRQIGCSVYQPVAEVGKTTAGIITDEFGIARSGIHTQPVSMMTGCVCPRKSNNVPHISPATKIGMDSDAVNVQRRLGVLFTPDRRVMHGKNEGPDNRITFRKRPMPFFFNFSFNQRRFKTQPGTGRILPLVRCSEVVNLKNLRNVVVFRWSDLHG